MAAEPKLIVALEARLNKFENQLKQAGLIADRQVRNIESRFAKMNIGGSFATNFAKGAIAAFSLQQALQGTLNLLKKVSDIQDVSERVGLTAEQFQELQFAIKQTGGEVEGLAASMDQFLKRVSEARAGKGDLGKLLEAQPGGLKVTGDISRDLLLVADLMRNAKDEADQLNIAMIAFGKGGAKTMVSALKGGSDEFIRMGTEARNTGNVLKNSVVKEGDRLKDLFDKLYDSTEKFAASKIIEWIPKVQAFLNMLDQWANKVLPIFKFLNQFNPLALGWDKIVEQMPESESGIAGGPSSFGGPTRVGTIYGRGRTVIPKGGVGSKESLDAFQQAIKAAQEHTAATIAETEAIDDGAAAVENAKLKLTLTNAAIEANTKAGKANTAVTAEQAANIEAVAAAALNAAKGLETANGPLRSFAREARDMNKNLQEAGVNALKGLEDALVDIATGAKTTQEAIKAMVDAILADLLRLAIRMTITGPLAGSLGGMMGPGGFSLAPAGRMAGGPVSAGSPYMVGEHGAELFIPNRTGTVVPNQAMGRTGSGFHLQIINNGAQVETSEPRQNADGSLSLVVMVDRVTAKNGSTPGTATNKMLRSQGGKMPLVQRA